MYKQLALLLAALTLAPGALAQQDSTVPESVRAMILRSQAATQYEQIGRMQTSVQYEDFLDALSGGPQQRSRVEAELVAILSERAELSEQVVAGQATEAELRMASDFEYLRERLAPLLTPAELALLDARRKGPSDVQLKQGYLQELERSAGALTAANKTLVLDTLVKHIRRSESESAGQGELSVDDLISLQSRAMMQAAAELQPQLAGEQLQQMMAFLNRLQMNLYMNHDMSDAPR